MTIAVTDRRRAASLMKECAYCGSEFEPALAQCSHCGRPYDPSGAKLAWEKMSSWERTRYMEILEWEQRPSGGGWISKATDLALAPVVWAGEKVTPQGVIDAVIKAVERGLEVVHDVAQFSTRREAVLADMQKELGINKWEDVRKIDLEGIDRLVLSYGGNHKVAALLEGAGMGVGGLAFVAADIPSLMTISMRLMCQMSYLHGRDPAHEREREFMLEVLQFGGVSNDQKAKVAIMKELNDIAIAAARDWTWKRLDKLVIVQVIKKVCEALGIRLTKRKLLQLVPILGSACAAGVNYFFLKDIAVSGRQVYAKRFLYDKYLLPEHSSRKRT